MAKKVVMNNPLEIPYNRAVRVGNFKLWRSKYVITGGKEKTSIDALNISNLDGSWMTRIPATEAMFGYICRQYAVFDENIREQMLSMVLGNMIKVCLIPSEYLHDAFNFLVEMMAFPYNLLSEKEMEKRMKDNMKHLGVDIQKAKEHISKMIELRRQLYELIEKKKTAYIDEYERQQHERWEKEEEAQKQLEQDEIAEQAMEILQENP